MTKTEQEHIDTLTKELKAQYGPVMRRQDIKDFLRFGNLASVTNWVCANGLTGKQARFGYYYTADIARAFVLGAA